MREKIGHIRIKKISDFRTCHAKEHILLCENGFILALKEKEFLSNKEQKKFFISEVLPKGVAPIYSYLKSKNCNSGKTKLNRYLQGIKSKVKKKFWAVFFREIFFIKKIEMQFGPNDKLQDWNYHIHDCEIRI